MVDTIGLPRSITNALSLLRSRLVESRDAQNAIALLERELTAYKTEIDKLERFRLLYRVEELESAAEQTAKRMGELRALLTQAAKSTRGRVRRRINQLLEKEP